MKVEKQKLLQQHQLLSLLEAEEGARDSDSQPQEDDHHRRQYLPRRLLSVLLLKEDGHVCRPLMKVERYDDEVYDDGCCCLWKRDQLEAMTKKKKLQQTLV